MTNLRKLEDLLIECLRPRLSKFGFEFQRQSRGFIKSVEGNLLSFHLAVIKHDSDFDVVADMAIRLEELETFLDKYRPASDSGSPKPKYTFGAEVGNLTGTGQKRWTIAAETDVKPTCDALSECFEKVGLPYFEKMSTPHGAYQLIKGPSRESWIHSPIHLKRARRSIALAILCNQVEDIPLLVLNYLEILQQVSAADLHAFESFVAQVKARIDPQDV